MKRIETHEELQTFLARLTNYERQAVLPYDERRLGLDRMRSLARELGDVHRARPGVHVAGTKGKGSTCLILEALLGAEGLAVGTYTSPHLVTLRERVRIDGRSISEAELIAALNAIRPPLERRRHEGGFPTFFELMTALAMAVFRQRRVDAAIWETGLGGRLDATNIVEPELTAITGIDLEHTRQLGSTRARIAAEKAGIIKRGTPLVVAELGEEARGVIERRARELGASLHVAAASSVRPIGDGRIEVHGLTEPLLAPAIRGPGLRASLAIAVALWRRFLERRGSRPRADRAAAALRELVLPGRVELWPAAVPALLDGAHTAGSFRALAAACDEIRLPRPRCAVVSIAADKDLDAIAGPLAALADDLVATRADPIRSRSPGEITARLGFGRTLEEPEAALEAARATRPGSVVICGSMYLAGALRPRLVREAGHH